MNRTVVLIFLLMVGLSVAGQKKLVFIKKYYTGFDQEELRETFKISGERFSFGKKNVFYINETILDTFSKDSTFHLEVYKDRYLVVSFYLIEKNMSPATAEVEGKYRVTIYDLKTKGKKWNFYFAGYNSSSFRWFKPNKGKVKFASKDIFDERD